MLKKLFLFAAFLFALLLLGGTAALIYPFSTFNEILKNEYRGKWYKSINYRPELLQAGRTLKLKETDEKNPELWTNFHLQNIVLPLPVKNPFYDLLAQAKFSEDDKKLRLGVSILGTNQREILQVFFNESSFMPVSLNKQRLFKLPLVQNYLKSIPDQQIWKDLFTRDLSEVRFSYKEMLYSIYLLDLRGRLIPSQTRSYSFIEGTDSALLSLASIDKDYSTELILTRSRGLIYSYLILTRLGDEQGASLRRKILREVEFRRSTSSLSKLIYTEFKNLDFKAKTSNFGMIYLLSSWSHDLSNPYFIREMIYHLQRGKQNELQLIPLVEYAFKRYGKTFVTKSISHLEIDQEIKLAAQLELEGQREDHQATRAAQEEFNLPAVPAKKKVIRHKKNRIIIE